MVLDGFLLIQLCDMGDGTQNHQFELRSYREYINLDIARLYDCYFILIFIIFFILLTTGWLTSFNFNLYFQTLSSLSQRPATSHQQPSLISTPSFLTLKSITMRFSIISVALTLAAFTSAVPFGASDSSNDILARDNTANGLDNAGHEFVVRGIDPDTLNLFARAILDARAKYRAGAYTLTTTRMEKGTKPNADEIDDGKRAMCGAGVTDGYVIYGWHGEGTSTADPLNHFTIQPTKGTNSGKGKIHVHEDGSWTQGDSGKISGKPC